MLVAMFTCLIGSVIALIVDDSATAMILVNLSVLCSALDTRLDRIEKVITLSKGATDPQPKESP
jgi:hypothetical protein